MAQVGSSGGAAAGAAFWRFSLALYSREGVAAALLALQDRAGRDVNLILYALWLGAVCGRALDRATLDGAAAAIAQTAAVVAELRARRRQLRAAPEPALQALRRRLLALEVGIERDSQCRLAACRAPAPTGGPGDRLARAAANLDFYLGRDSAAPEVRVIRAALAGLMRRAEG